MAHVTQCPWCISGHTRAAGAMGITEEEIAEAIFVAMEMRAGAALRVWLHRDGNCRRAPALTWHSQADLFTTLLDSRRLLKLEQCEGTGTATLSDRPWPNKETAKTGHG